MMKPHLRRLLNCPKPINNLTLLLIFGAFFACQETEESSAQFNASGETLSVSVGSSELLPDVERFLHSTTGSVEIGRAIVTPGGGPIGTEHQIQVEVFDEWEEEVASVVLETSSGSRGNLEYTLTPDSADQGLYLIVIESVGDEGEIREDEFTFRLWTGEAPEDSGEPQ